MSPFFLCLRAIQHLPKERKTIAKKVRKLLIFEKWHGVGIAIYGTANAFCAYPACITPDNVLNSHGGMA